MGVARTGEGSAAAQPLWLHIAPIIQSTASRKAGSNARSSGLSPFASTSSAIGFTSRKSRVRGAAVRPGAALMRREPSASCPCFPEMGRCGGERRHRFTPLPLRTLCEPRSVRNSSARVATERPRRRPKSRRRSGEFLSICTGLVVTPSGSWASSSARRSASPTGRRRNTKTALSSPSLSGHSARRNGSSSSSLNSPKYRCLFVSLVPGSIPFATNTRTAS